MKKYTKIIAFALLFVLVLSGCGNTSGGEINGDHSQFAESTEQDAQSNTTEEAENTEQTDTGSPEIPEDSQIPSEPEENTNTEPEDSQEIPEREHTLYAKSSVNVRSIPSTDGKKLGTLSLNQAVTALGDAVDGWQKVRYKDVIAYVSAKYLVTEKIESKEPVKPSGQVDEITAEDIPLPDDFDPNKTVIVIDAGHQGKGNSEKEPDGPGSNTLKAKVLTHSLRRRGRRRAKGNKGRGRRRRISILRGRLLKAHC